MSFKPEIFTTDQVIQQTQELTKKKNDLALQLQQVTKKLESVNNMVSENQFLAESAKEFLIESVNLYIDEWKSVETHYPEIRLGIIQKAAELLGAEPPAPTAPKAPATPPKGGAPAPAAPPKK